MRRQSDPLRGIVPVFVLLGVLMFIGEVVAQWLGRGGPR